MTDQPVEPCGRTEPHPAHKFMRGRRVSRCPGADCTPPLHAATCPATADLWLGVAPGGNGEPDLLASFRALADRYASEAAEQDRNVAALDIDEVGLVQWGIAAGWRHAEGLLRHTINSLDNSRTTPNNPTTSTDTTGIRERYAEAIRWNMQFSLQDAEFDGGPDSIQRINEWVDWIAKTLTAVRDVELERLRADLAALRAIATGYCPHCGRGDCTPTPDQYLEQVHRADGAEAAVARVRALHVRNANAGVCEHCSAGDYPDYAVPYPCPTIQALNGPTEATP